ncbi:MAG: hypothetical protein JWN23_183 [Rhodocyclales bacterium]|nr:hypothetical protein [Rhodocyclales bacterium]
MKLKAPKPRNLVHLAMLRTTRNVAHGKSPKQQRANSRIALRRKLRDEGVFVQCVITAH